MSTVFVCNDCGRGFNIKANLVNRPCMHTAEKPFACNVCSKRFSQNGQLSRHYRIHTIEKYLFVIHVVTDLVNSSNLAKHSYSH